MYIWQAAAAGAGAGAGGGVSRQLEDTLVAAAVAGHYTLRPPYAMSSPVKRSAYTNVAQKCFANYSNHVFAWKIIIICRLKYAMSSPCQAVCIHKYKNMAN